MGLFSRKSSEPTTPDPKIAEYQKGAAVSRAEQRRHTAAGRHRMAELHRETADRYLDGLNTINRGDHRG
jgi:hypothetical protein